MENVSSPCALDIYKLGQELYGFFKHSSYIAFLSLALPDPTLTCHVVTLGNSTLLSPITCEENKSFANKYHPPPSPPPPWVIHPPPAPLPSFVYTPPNYLFPSSPLSSLQISMPPNNIPASRFSFMPCFFASTGYRCVTVTTTWEPCSSVSGRSRRSRDPSTRTFARRSSSPGHTCTQGRAS